MAEPYVPTIKDFDFLFKFLFAYFFIQVWGILTGQGRTFEKVPGVPDKESLAEELENINTKIESIENVIEKLKDERKKHTQGTLKHKVLSDTINTFNRMLNTLTKEKQEKEIKLDEINLAIENEQLGVVVTEAKNLSTQRKYLFQFVFLTISMFIFAFTMIAFLEVPGRDIANIAIFIFVAATLMKYLFDFSILEKGQSYMIVLAALSLYVDSFRETAERIAAQF
jgi:hypothetical protein